MNRVVQYRYPFETLPSSFSGKCRLGISISEDEFMKLNSSSELEPGQIPQPYQGFSFVINGERIYMGKTCMYQTDTYLNITNFSLSTTAAKSVLVQVIYNE